MLDITLDHNTIHFYPQDVSCLSTYSGKRRAAPRDSEGKALHYQAVVYFKDGKDATMFFETLADLSSFVASFTTAMDNAGITKISDVTANDTALRLYEKVKTVQISRRSYNDVGFQQEDGKNVSRFVKFIMESGAEVTAFSRYPADVDALGAQIVADSGV